MVRIMIRSPGLGDQCRRYSRSYSIRRRMSSSWLVSPRHPFTWARPVIPGRHLVPDHVALDQAPILFIVRHRMGSRTDQAHVAAQDIDELRQLVNGVPAQQTPDRRDPPSSRVAC